MQGHRFAILINWAHQKSAEANNRLKLLSAANSVSLNDRSGGVTSNEIGDLPLESSQGRPAGVRFSNAPNSPFCTVSVVVCTRNRPGDLTACLDAISRLNPSPDDILVIDNSDGDPAAERAAREHGARYVVERAIGLSRARNRALAESSSEIVAFIDDDAQPSEDWLEQILAPFADPQMAMVSGEVESAGIRRDRTLPVRTLGASDPQWFEIATFGGIGPGTGMALRKSACSGWKGFDVRLGRGAPFHIAEEHHAAAALVNLGHRVAVAPAAIVHHPFKPLDGQHLAREAACSFAYWLLLLSEFPGRRLDLIRFLIRRLRGKPLTWPRDPQVPGQIVSSRWMFRIKAGFAGTLLYLRSR